MSSLTKYPVLGYPLTPHIHGPSVSMVDFHVKGLNKVKAKGRVYYYHRATGKRIRADFGTSAFLAEIEQIVARQQGCLGDRIAYPSGTLGALVAAYRGSPEFAGLAPRTRADYQAVLDYLKPIDAELLSTLTKSDVIAIRDAAFAARKRRFANYVVSVLSLMLNWGLVRALAPMNPAGDVPKIRRPRGLPKANRRWTREELDVVLSAAPPELQLPIALAVCTGMREGDVLVFPWSGYERGVVTRRAAKTGYSIEIPAHPVLRGLLDAAPRCSPVVVVGARGRPFTLNGFRARFFKLIRALQAEGRVQPGLTFHGLRTTTATLLAEAGCDTQTIMAITGHTTEAMVAHYTREASRKGRAKAAIRRLKL